MNKRGSKNHTNINSIDRSSSSIRRDRVNYHDDKLQ